MENLPSFFIPVSGMSFVFDAAMLYAMYFIVKSRTKHLSETSSFRYWESFFLNMAIFLTIMALPHILLFVAPDKFPPAMNWAFTIGRVFIFLAVSSTARLFSLFVWKQKADSIYKIWLFFGAIIFILSFFYPTHTTFDIATKVTLTEAHPMIGALIPIYVTITWLPLAVLFLVSGIKNKQIRTRSLLLAAGLITQMIAGPMHEYARTAQSFLIADGFTTLSDFLLLLGILYKTGHSQNTTGESSFNK